MNGRNGTVRSGVAQRASQTRVGNNYGNYDAITPKRYSLTQPELLVCRAMPTHLRRRPVRPFSILLLGVLSLWLSGVISTYAQDLLWRASNVEVPNDGNWFNPNNWNANGDAVAPPTATESAVVNTAPTANVAAPGAQARFLIIGGTPADANNTGAPFNGVGTGQVLVSGPTASLQLGQEVEGRPAFSLDVVNGSLTVENGGTLVTTNTRVGTFQPGPPPLGAVVAAQLAPTAPAFIDITGAGSSWIEHGTLADC